MRSLWILCSAAAIGAIASTSAVRAADLPVKAPPVVVAPIYNWTGIYVGLNGGGVWGGRESFFDDAAVGIPPGSITNLNPGSSGVAGGQIGARYQINQFVLGLEATADWTDLRDRFFKGGAGEFVDFHISGLYTLTGQVGWAVDKWLFYGKGGWAEATSESNLNAPGAFFSVPSGQHNTGWTVGAGVEYAVWKNVIAGIEYDHYDLGYKPYTAAVSNGGFPYIVFNTSRLTMDQVVARLSYKFDIGPTSVVAKY